jgi:hypothetical protein
MKSSPKIVTRKAGAEGFASFRDLLIGMPVSATWQGHGSAIFLEFGKLRRTTRLDGKKGQPKGDATLMIEWSWRIEGARSILCGSWSDAPLWPNVLAGLAGAKVKELSLFGRLRELEVTLSNRMQVITFSTIEGQPHWTLFDRRSDTWLTNKRGTLCIEKAVSRKS